MITGIYVSASTTLTFQSSESVTLVCYDSSKPPIVASGTPLQASVAAGIYKIESNDPVHTSPGGTITVFESSNVKDPTPDPPGFASSMYENKASLCAFFVRPDVRSAAFPTSAPAR
jgi:hypothetical protein